MPELPEVEVIRRGIAPRLKGRRIIRVAGSGLAMRHLPTDAEITAIIGSTITNIRRRAKYIIIELDCDLSLILHLGMTGRIGIMPGQTPPVRHDHLRIDLENGRELRLNDSRRFGGVWICTPGERTRLFAPLGPEPLTAAFSAAYMDKLSQGRRRAIKNLLMDNHVVVGIGNIYASEALFAAGIHPARASDKVSTREWRALVAASKEVLRAGIKNGGATISDYRNSDGMPGYFQNRLMVYGRDQCGRCGKKVKRIILGGRASFFCPQCQR